MIIIAGLGNPGKEYSNTPHNVGFESIDLFAEKNNFPAFEFSKYSNALVSQKGEVILVKPQTFMNNSGLSIKKLSGSRSDLDLIVVHDDIDLPLGEFKISKNKGSAGHNGAESIIKELGTKDFTRVRIGICPEKKPESVEKYVLKKLSKKNQEILLKTLSEVVQHPMFNKLN